MEENKVNFIIPSQNSEPSQPKKTNSHVFSNINFNEDSNDFNVKVIGIGGAGCNVIGHIAQNHPNVANDATLYAFNTDLTSLRSVKNVQNLFLLNKEELKGYGSNADPKLGRKAINHDAEIIKQELVGTDILIIVAGMGKGTGSGGAPELALIAHELGILTISIVTMPAISSEGSTIYNNAFGNLQFLITNSDAITTICNDKIIDHNKNISFYDIFQKANEQIATIVEGITNIIYHPGTMNVNFATLKNFFKQNKYFLSDRVHIDLLNYSPTTLKQAIIDKIKQSLTDIKINNCPSIITNINLSKEAPPDVLIEINKTFTELTKNNRLAIANGVDYNDDKKIDISFLIAGESYSAGFEDALNQSSDVLADLTEPTIKLEAVNDPEANEYDNLMDEVVKAAKPTEDIIKENQKIEKEEI